MAAFVSGYLAPGVYDRTLLDPNVASLLGGLRIPLIIGTGEEQLLLLNQDVVRGSSSSIDNKASNEDVSSQANGTNTVFKVLHYPIVTGTGTGTITNKVSDVVVNVNNNPVPVVRVDGLNGLVTVQLPPVHGDTVTITYYFKLTDTKITGEDVSAQADGTNKTFYTEQKPIVDGRGSGTPTTTATDVIANVNGLAVTVSQVDGVDGYVVLLNAPHSTDTVTLTYYFNMYSDTYDLLPQSGLTSVVSCGDSPDLDNYLEGVDFIILDGNKIQWGAGILVTVMTHTSGSIYFQDQITTLLIDDHILNEDVSSQISPSNRAFTIKYAPIVDGTGRDMILGTGQDVTPVPVQAYDNGVEVTISRVDGATGTVYLKAIPVGPLVTISYYRSQLLDNSYSLNVVTAAATGIGTYKITTNANGSLYNAKVTAFASTPTPALMYGTRLRAGLNTAVNETVTITFATVTTFNVTSSLLLLGSHGSGVTGQTYIDALTGLQFTIKPDAYHVNDTITIICSNDLVPGTLTHGPFLTGTSSAPTDLMGPEYIILGTQLLVSDTLNTSVGDITNVQTFDHSGHEPAIGSIYYISYYYQKTDFTPKVFTTFPDVTSEYGPLSIDNQLTLSAFLMMINGAQAVMCMQILKQPGQNIASDEAFINALVVTQKPINGIKPRVIHVVTTSQTVIANLMTNLATMSSERRRAERTAFIGFAVGTAPQDASNYAQSLGYSRIVAVYPDGALITLTDEQGVSSNYILDGSYIAAAMAGLAVSTTYDVAEPLTRKVLTGFASLIRDMDDIEMDQVASAGVTVIFSDSGILKVRHALTTDMSNPFNKAPNIVAIMDEVQIQARAALDQYIGRKFLDSTATNVAATLASTLSALKEANIINDYANITAKPSDVDPNYLVVEAFYKPVFELSYIRVTFNIRAKL